MIVGGWKEGEELEETRDAGSESRVQGSLGQVRASPSTEKCPAEGCRLGSGVMGNPKSHYILLPISFMLHPYLLWDSLF